VIIARPETLPEAAEAQVTLPLHGRRSRRKSRLTTSGRRTAAGNADADMLEVLRLPADDPVRLFRSAAHPLLRRTLLSIDDQRHIL